MFMEEEAPVAENFAIFLGYLPFDYITKYKSKIGSYL